MDDSTDDERARERLQLLGKAIRAFRGDRTQAELGMMLGGLPQTTISRWESGLVDLGVTQVRQLEDALGLLHGTLGRAAGYVSNVGYDDELDGFRFDVFDSFEAAMVELLAAETLGIGVTISNRWGAPDDEGVRTMEWIVVLSTDPAEVA